MNPATRLLPLFLALCVSTLPAQMSTSAAPQARQSMQSSAPQAAYYVDPAALKLQNIIPDPPAPGSAEAQAELAELHHIEQSRTPAQVASAQADEARANIFAFSTVLGPGFTAQALPLTAVLGDRVNSEQNVAGSALKSVFERPRPYQADATLHPVCAVTQGHNSYPSGHALTAYLEAFTLAELLPNQRAAILARADDFAHQRLVCGVHYPSDLEAGRRVAYVLFGDMLTSAKFQQDLAAARTELQTKLATH